MSSPRPFRLTPSFRDKVWGVTNLDPWFQAAGEKTGEVWFLAPGSDPLPILVKFIFTSEKLSVQVHPDDAYARQHEGSAGKTEMWHILRAEPGAKLALGFRDTITHQRAREAALSGEIEELVEWFPVSSGQTFFIPARTVHAIGAGITLCEIQQQSDITYRLYDYGRPREVHLDKALEVADLGPHPGPSVPRGNVLASCDYFVTERLDLDFELRYQPEKGRFHLLIVLEGSGKIAEEPFRQGEVWMVPAGCPPFALAGPARLLRTSVP